MTLRITVSGGAGEIGGNRILLSWDDAAWMLDVGTRFAATSRYFEEFVNGAGGDAGAVDHPSAPWGPEDGARKPAAAESPACQPGRS